MAKRKAKYIIGIDEVGRGALAGPVVVAAACMPVGMRIKNSALGKLKDSKKLSPKAREAWKKHFASVPGIVCMTARVYPRAIERINISQAANRAATSALERLIKSIYHDTHRKHSHILENVRMFDIFLDGGLFVDDQDNLPAKTIIRGDEKITAIMVASIAAKVERDRYMEKLSRKHPGYGFEIHKGYGTKRHLGEVRRRGPSEAHRLTFLGGRM